LHLYDMGGEGFLLKIDVEVETWYHYFKPEYKWLLREWHHMTSSRKKIFQSVPSNYGTETFLKS
jgi:hypothetical protein